MLPRLLGSHLFKMSTMFVVMMGNVLAPLNLGCCCVQASLFSAECSHCVDVDDNAQATSCCETAPIKSTCCGGSCSEPTDESSKCAADDKQSAEERLQNASETAATPACHSGHCECCRASSVELFVASRDSNDDQQLVSEAPIGLLNFSVPPRSEMLSASANNTHWLPNLQARALLCVWLN